MHCLIKNRSGTSKIKPVLQFGAFTKNKTKRREKSILRNSFPFYLLYKYYYMQKDDLEVGHYNYI